MSKRVRYLFGTAAGASLVAIVVSVTGQLRRASLVADAAVREQGGGRAEPAHDPRFGGPVGR